MIGRGCSCGSDARVHVDGLGHSLLTQVFGHRCNPLNQSGRAPVRQIDALQLLLQGALGFDFNRLVRHWLAKHRSAVLESRRRGSRLIHALQLLAHEDRQSAEFARGKGACEIDELCDGRCQLRVHHSAPACLLCECARERSQEVVVAVELPSRHVRLSLQRFDLDRRQLAAGFQFSDLTRRNEKQQRSFW